jgi:hypothetical protein
MIIAKRCSALISSANKKLWPVGKAGKSTRERSMK